MPLISEKTRQQEIPFNSSFDKFTYSTNIYLFISTSLPTRMPVAVFPLLRDIKKFSETSTYVLHQGLVNDLEKLYILEGAKEIKRFLLSNNYLIEILLEAPNYIQHIFGQVPIYLELHHDPEEGWDELFIIIKSPYKAEEAIALEKKLFEEWFVYRMESTKGKLNITEEPL